MPVTHNERGETLYIGAEFHCVPDLYQAVEDTCDAGGDFVCVPLVHPRYHRGGGLDKVNRDEPFTRSDLLLNSSDWNACVVGKSSTWMDLDSSDYNVRRRGELAFKEEIAWASHLSLQAVTIPTPTWDCANYAQCINDALGSHHYMLSLWARFKLVDEVQGDSINGHNTADPWEIWNKLRSLCGHAPSLCAALELTGDLPSAQCVDKWCGEPVRCVIIPLDIFLTNKAGFPCLSKRHQQVVLRFFEHKVQIALKGVPNHEQGITPYIQYIGHLFQSRPKPTQQESFESPYYDYLQAPLQPLMDNLESQTYETFEKDPVKYAQYQLAVYKALLDRQPEKSDKKTVLMVVGAGRGPLVRASLRASEEADRPIKVYAVEKNPNAVVTLRNMKESEQWGDKVTIVSSDMRVWKAPEKADILVSELLGSFGDNELSPECLDGAQSFLRDDGISIPCDYTSFVAPLQSSKLWNDVKANKDLASFETGYVVKVHNAYELAKAQPALYFEHPNHDDPIDNTRYKKMTFTAERSGTIHGFIGYFESTLYKDVIISIHPPTFSEGMFSWFPIYYPIQTPLYAPEGSTIEINLWRKEGNHKVWYEWAFSAPQCSPIHNPNGRSSFIGL